MKCRWCGREFHKEAWIPYDDVCSSTQCFYRQFWSEILAEKDKYVFINHTCYKIASEQDTSEFRGYGGRKFTIRFFDSGEVVNTTNLWCRGDVPEEYWNDMPDTAEFLNEI